jgi:hypothetical protein
MVTLSLVLGGTAVAATTASHKDAKADTKLVRKLAPSLSVKHAATANSASTATSATHATSADSATNATNAANATNATNATHATSADSATNATNATNLGGQPASNFLTTANRIGTNGIVNEAASNAGNTVTLFTVGPFTVTMLCQDTGTGPAIAIDATSTEANSVINGSLLATPNTPTQIEGIGASTTFQHSGNFNDDFEAPSGAHAILEGALGTNSLGTDCWANYTGIN